MLDKSLIQGSVFIKRAIIKANVGFHTSNKLKRKLAILCSALLLVKVESLFVGLLYLGQAGNEKS